MPNKKTPQPNAVRQSAADYFSTAELKAALHNCAKAWGNHESLALELGINAKSYFSDLINPRKPRNVPDFWMVWHASLLSGDTTLHRMMTVKLGLQCEHDRLRQRALMHRMIEDGDFDGDGVVAAAIRMKATLSDDLTGDFAEAAE